MFLQEKFITFQFSQLISNLLVAMSRKFDFLNIFVDATPKVQDRLCEFYLHNYFVQNDIKWNPLLFVGDLQIRVLASYFRNEMHRGEIM